MLGLIQAMEKPFRAYIFQSFACLLLILSLAACQTKQSFELDVVTQKEQKAQARAEARREAEHRAEIERQRQNRINRLRHMPQGMKLCQFSYPKHSNRELVRWAEVVERSFKDGRVYLQITGHNPRYRTDGYLMGGLYWLDPTEWERCP